MNEIDVDGEVYTKDCKDEVLEQLLLQHLGLDFLYELKITLTDMQLLTLKSWLVEKTEREMSPGENKRIQHSVQEVTDGGPVETLFARGKKANGEVVLWHESLPWPDEWGERISVLQPDRLELEKDGSGIILTYSGFSLRFTKSQTEKLHDAIKSSFASSNSGATATAKCNKGMLEIQNLGGKQFVLHFNQESHSFSTTFEKQSLEWIVDAIEKLNE